MGGGMIPYDLSIPGWMDENELQWLHETANGMASVVEIGCYQGRSTFALLQGCPGPVFAIDPWVDIMGTGADNFALFCGNIFSRLPKAEWQRLTMLRVKSSEVDRAFGPVDMVFVDGDHLEPGVALDLELWTPRAKKLICGHDYHNSEWPDVTKVVDRVFGSRVTNPTGCIWAVSLPEMAR